MKAKLVDRIRAFNRFYLPEFDLLGDSYLGSEYSATEARVLFEVYTEDGCTAAAIARTLHIDKSYLSRVIRKHEQKGYLERTVSKEDGRAYELHLTGAGMARTEEFIQKSNEQIGERIGNLNAEECDRLLTAFETITQILKGVSV